MNVTAVALALAMAQAPGQAVTPPPTQQPAAPRADAAPAGPVLSLEEAMRVAAERNLDVRILRAQLDQAAEISWKAWSGYLPQLGAFGAYQWQSRIRGEFDFDGPGGDPPTLQELQGPKQRQGQIELTQTLVSPALFFGIRGASSSERAAELNIESGRRALIFGVASVYYGVASLRQLLGVAERLLEIAQRQERDARVRFQAGTIARVGLLRAEIDRARAEQDLVRARNLYLSSKVALATLLDRDTAFEVAPPPEPPLPPNPDPDALAAKAILLRPDVQAARVQIDAARAQRKAAYGRYFPNIGAFGRVQSSRPASLFGGGNDTWVAGLQAQWQILDGGLRESDIREASARLAEAEARAARAEAVARQEVTQAVLDLESARANAIKAKEQRDLAAENLRLLDVSYRAGAATAVEQADATAELRTAEITLQTETLAAQLAAVRVLNVAGEFDPMPRRRR